MLTLACLKSLFSDCNALFLSFRVSISILSTLFSWVRLSILFTWLSIVFFGGPSTVDAPSMELVSDSISLALSAMVSHGIIVNYVPFWELASSCLWCNDLLTVYFFVPLYIQWIDKLFSLSNPFRVFLQSYMLYRMWIFSKYCQCLFTLLLLGQKHGILLHMLVRFPENLICILRLFKRPIRKQSEFQRDASSSHNASMFSNVSEFNHQPDSPSWIFESL